MDSHPDADEALESLGELADTAGAMMRAGIGSAGARKADGTLVSPVDTKLNDLAIAYLRERHPGCGILGEEASFKPDRPARFVIDPIDGTLPYVAGLGISSFVGAYEHAEDPIAAIVDDPFTNTWVTATAGGGCRHNGVTVQLLDGPLTRLVAVEAVRHTAISRERLGHALGSSELHDITLHSFAVAASRVALGKISGAVFARHSRWDISAVALICAEAGAVVSDLAGRPLRPGGGTPLSCEDGLVVAHPDTHARIVAAIARSR